MVEHPSVLSPCRRHGKKSRARECRSSAATKEERQRTSHKHKKRKAARSRRTKGSPETEVTVPQRQLADAKSTPAPHFLITDEIENRSRSAVPPARTSTTSNLTSNKTVRTTREAEGQTAQPPSRSATVAGGARRSSSRRGGASRAPSGGPQCSSPPVLKRPTNTASSTRRRGQLSSQRKTCGAASTSRGGSAKPQTAHPVQRAAAMVTRKLHRHNSASAKTRTRSSTTATGAVAAACESGGDDDDASHACDHSGSCINSSGSGTSDSNDGEPGACDSSFSDDAHRKGCGVPRDSCNSGGSIYGDVEDDFGAIAVSDEGAPYDEEDEEEAVLRYVDAGAATQHRLRSDRGGPVVPLQSTHATLDSSLSACSGGDPDDALIISSIQSACASARSSACHHDAATTDDAPMARAAMPSIKAEYIAAAMHIGSDISMYNAFFLNAERTAWMVDARVLAKVCEYTRLMRHAPPPPQRERDGRRWTAMFGAAAAVDSPLQATKKSAGQLGHSDPTACRLRPSRASSAAWLRKQPTTFLWWADAMRWLDELEYFISAVLFTCAAGGDGATPCIPPAVHPVLWIAALALQRSSGREDVAFFQKQWSRQVRLVLGTAAPAHQRVYEQSEDGVRFSSDCEGGNLAHAERVAGYTYALWLAPDVGCEQRIWFRFSVSGVQAGRVLRLRLMNLSPHVTLYRRNGMQPVWRDGAQVPSWTAVDHCAFRTTHHSREGELTFAIHVRSSTESLQVAFCAPYTYADLLCHLCAWHAQVRHSRCAILFEERVLCHSPEGRKLHLLIITGPDSGGVAPPHGSDAAAADGHQQSARDARGAAALRGPYANFGGGKKVVLLSGRVHPGEVTASHALHGLVAFLLSDDHRAQALREHFIFFIVPMVNPDGVSRGHSRLDPYGNNLNRCYGNPDPVTQPTVRALKLVYEHLQRTYRERFMLYIDIHSHASQSSAFVFGNHLPATVQHWNMLLPKLMELHARGKLAFDLCRFGRAHMTRKAGASRVLFGQHLIHSYTLEVPYFTRGGLLTSGQVELPPGRTAAGSLAKPGRSPPKLTRSSPLTAADGGGHSRAPSTPRHLSSPAFKAAKRAHSAGGNAASSGSAELPPALPDDREGAAAAATSPNCYSSPSSRWSPGEMMPSVLADSAAVGRACALALLDYCSVPVPPTGATCSAELMAVGGLDCVLAAVRAQRRPVGAGKEEVPSSTAGAPRAAPSAPDSVTCKPHQAKGDGVSLF